MIRLSSPLELHTAAPPAPSLNVVQAPFATSGENGSSRVQLRGLFLAVWTDSSEDIGRQRAPLKKSTFLPTKRICTIVLHERLKIWADMRRVEAQRSRGGGRAATRFSQTRKCVRSMEIFTVQGEGRWHQWPHTKTAHHDEIRSFNCHLFHSVFQNQQ